MSEFTEIMLAADAGEVHAANRLLPLVYDELRKLAAAKLSHEPAGQTLQPTALVHEAFLRLVGDADVPRWDSRGHFFAAASEAMRRILVDAARRKKRLKHGGDRDRRELLDGDVAAPQIREDLLALDESLDRLAAVDPSAAQLVQLRYFAGLTIPQAAKFMHISPRKADRLWAYAKAWIYQDLQEAASLDAN